MATMIASKAIITWIEFIMHIITRVQCAFILQLHCDTLSPGPSMEMLLMMLLPLTLAPQIQSLDLLYLRIC